MLATTVQLISLCPLLAIFNMNNFISGKDVLLAVAHTSLADPQASTCGSPSQPCGLHGTLPDGFLP